MHDDRLDLDRSTPAGSDQVSLFLLDPYVKLPAGVLGLALV